MNDAQSSFRRLLAEKGITLEELAAAIGLSPVSVNDQVCKNTHSHRRARKIEKFLGAPIWTSLERFDELRRAEAILGTDPVLTGFHELRRRAIKLRIPEARLLTSKDAVVSAVLANATPTLTNSPHEKAAD